MQESATAFRCSAKKPNPDEHLQALDRRIDEALKRFPGPSVSMAWRFGALGTDALAYLDRRQTGTHSDLARCRLSRPETGPR